VSGQSIWGGFNMPLIIIVLGVLGVFLDFIFFIAFIALLGYYLYRLERRISNLEGPGSQDQQAKKPKQN